MFCGYSQGHLKNKAPYVIRFAQKMAAAARKSRRRTKHVGLVAAHEPEGLMTLYLDNYDAKYTYEVKVHLKDGSVLWFQPQLDAVGYGTVLLPGHTRPEHVQAVTAVTVVHAKPEQKAYIIGNSPSCRVYSDEMVPGTLARSVADWAYDPAAADPANFVSSDSSSSAFLEDDSDDKTESDTEDETKSWSTSSRSSCKTNKSSSRSKTDKDSSDRSSRSSSSSSKSRSTYASLLYRRRRNRKLSYSSNTSNVTSKT
jgi:hypothetical protein